MSDVSFVRVEREKSVNMQKQILVVEDNELNRAILCDILSDSYRVLEAENGQEALDVLHLHEDSISLILLDVMMPVMDGYTFLNRIRDDAELSLIPVIVTTGRQRERRSGCTGSWSYGFCA